MHTQRTKYKETPEVHSQHGQEDENQVRPENSHHLTSLKLYNSDHQKINWALLILSQWPLSNEKDL